MTIEEGQALSEDATLAPRTGAAPVDRDELCAQVDWLRAVSRSLVRDPWRAEDVAQETLLAALATPPRDTGDAQQMRAWLGRVAFNLSRLGARRAARQQAREACVARRESLPPVTDELELASTTRVVAKAIAGLPEPHRSIVRLRYFEGLSTAEIAARLGTSELAVRKRLWRARAKLKETLERGAQREPFWGLVLPFSWPWPSTKSLTGLAAGVAASVGGLVWWSMGREAERALAPEVAALSNVQRSATRTPALDAGLPLAPDAEAETPERDGSRREAPGRGPVREERRSETALVSVRGLVLDLENRPQPELEVHAAGAPDEVLATSDGAGRFALETALPLGALVLEASAPDRATLVPARLARGFEAEPARIVVTPCADLVAHVEDEDGAPLAAARVELVCQATAFAALAFPVRLPSPLLRAAETDATGTVELAALPRGPGLVLRIQADGFEPVELASETLEEERWITLAAEATPAFLAGTVFHHDGLPAAGARVSLAEASAVADALGRYRLPLRGVRAESRLVASDPSEQSAPFVARRFGARLAPGLESASLEAALEEIPAVDLFLSEPLTLVRGALHGPAPAGWLVAAFATGEPLLEEDGSEAPAAVSRSDEAGAFTLALPTGAYDVYALSPAGAFALALRGLGTALDWHLELPAELPLVPALARLTRDDGRPLAGTTARVVACLPGSEGGRRLLWRELVSDDAGQIAFARDPALALELAVDHPHARGEFRWDEPGAVAEAVFPRPALLQLRAVPPEVVCATLLDGEGQALAARDAFGAASTLGFRAGKGPVVEVPPAARWVEFERLGLGATRVPLVPGPGKQVVVRP